MNRERTLEVIENYRPNPGKIPEEVWAVIAAFVRDAACRVGEMAPETMKNYIHAIAYFVFWAYERGTLLDVEVVFTPSRVEQYIQTATEDLVPASRATRRAALGRVGRAVTRRAPWQPQGRTFQMHQLQNPYTSTEVDLFLQMASQQSTPFKRRVATAQLCLGLGAGLHAREYLSVGPEHLVLHDEVFMLDIPGERARKVPMHQRYVDPLLAIGEKFPAEPFIAPLTDADPADRLDRILRAPDYPTLKRPTTNRLRTTWLTRMLRARCTLSEVLYMSGLQGTKSLIDLVPFIEFRNVLEWFGEAATFHD